VAIYKPAAGKINSCIRGKIIRASVAKEIRAFVAIPIRGNKLFGFIVGNSFVTR
jgi:hypothetical protein